MTEKIKNGITELVFILDKSGSMSGMENDTIGGFNSMIEQQREAEGKAYVTTVMFSSRSKTVHDREALENVKPLTLKDYRPDGMTALLDAIGGTICHISDIHKYIREEDVPGKTIFVITTDGMENASREYSSQKIKEMISQKEKEEGWEFLFVAANIDAVETAENIGIRRERAANYDVEKGTDTMYRSVSSAIKCCRMSGEIDKSWKDDIEATIRKKK